MPEMRENSLSRRIRQRVRDLNQSLNIVMFFYHANGVP